MCKCKIRRYFENNADFFGCDFTLSFDESEIKILQLTDMQIIDSAGCRTPDRLRNDEKEAWKKENIEENCLNHISSVIAQTNPDVIVITGDLVYGSFDDSGEILKILIDFLDSFKIPWVPVFGNHDNEAYIGVDKQCEMLYESEYCIFERGNVEGNSNFTVGIFKKNIPKRILYMLDSKGCIDELGIFPNQLELVLNRNKKIKDRFHLDVKGFMMFHNPVDWFNEAMLQKGYFTENRTNFVIGGNVPSQDGDIGFNFQNKFVRKACMKTDENFLKTLNRCKIDGVFVGHYHTRAFSILYKGIKWVQGLKTGFYDYHSPGHSGGTLITLKNNDDFSVQFVDSLMPIKNIPSKAPSYGNIFTDE